jgi:hypothetical protein
VQNAIPPWQKVLLTCIVADVGAVAFLGHKSHKKIFQGYLGTFPTHWRIFSICRIIFPHYREHSCDA